jgi:hypothetical protein
MRLKFKKSILGITLLLLIPFVLSNCVEEPTIDPVKRPFSEIRVVNLSHNVNNMKITIDGQQPIAALSALQQASTTSYFDVNSGKRRFVVTNEAGETLFNKEIEIISFERATICFAGFHSTDELENTFTFFTIEEGEVYVSSAPKAGKMNIYLVHGSADVDTSAARTYSVRYNYTPSGQTFTTLTGNLTFGNYRSLGEFDPGEYTIRLVAPSDSLSYTSSYDAGMRYYLFVYGDPNNPQIFRNDVVPQPIRSRD